VEAIIIGTVKTDQHAKERSLDASYPALNSSVGLRILLSDYHALKLRRFNGDTAASDIIIDLERAIELAKLTNRQRQALALVYFEDLTQEEAGKRMRIDKQGVNNLLDRGIEAISDIYYYWSGHGEGYALGDAVDNENITEEMAI
jgi:DNA-directed RNA polymerase specialized sigma24 family protein